MSEHTAVEIARPHRGRRVPVDYRWAGLDKRSFVPAFVVIGIWLLWAVVVPHLNDAVDYDDQVRAGEQFVVGDDLVFTPEPGWNVEAGFRTTDDPAVGGGARTELSNGGVSFIVSADDFSGTPDELLDQVDKVTTTTSGDETPHFTKQRNTVTTTSGLTGVAEGYSSPRAEGAIAAFVSNGTGVTVTIVGPPTQVFTMTPAMTRMVESIAPAGDQEAS